MLKMYLEKLPDGIEVVNDVEYLFLTVKLKCTDLEKKIVQEIEQGTLLDSNFFLDRFGCKLRVSYLSTGCKAALCVVNNVDKVINLHESGWNAQDAVLSLVHDGAIFIPCHELSFGCSDNIDVCLDGYRFITRVRLNYYVNSERFLVEPDFDKEGISHV